MALTKTQRLILARVILALTWMSRVSAGDVGADETIAVGAGKFEFAPHARRPQHRLTVWTYRPDAFGPDSPIVFVMHGVKRNGQGYRDNWAPHSRKAGFLLVVPEF